MQTPREQKDKRKKKKKEKERWQELLFVFQVKKFGKCFRRSMDINKTEERPFVVMLPSPCSDHPGSTALSFAYYIGRGWTHAYLITTKNPEFGGQLMPSVKSWKDQANILSRENNTLQTLHETSE